MHLTKTFLLAALALALASYAVDCSALQTPQAAMHCCASMPCSHGHGQQDCCKNMPSMHVPFVQPASLHNVQFSLSVAAALPVVANSKALDGSALLATVYCHAPPILPASLSPLRL
ncbi:MAG TPA: hypothetical protein VFM21_09650 [Terriglobia bacterium]|nr:hypothetical protein [Terriglobia bacterium]